MNEMRISYVEMSNILNTFISQRFLSEMSRIKIWLDYRVGIQFKVSLQIDNCPNFGGSIISIFKPNKPHH